MAYQKIGQRQNLCILEIAERKQIYFVARQQIIGLIIQTEGQKKIILWVRTDFHNRCCVNKQATLKQQIKKRINLRSCRITSEFGTIQHYVQLCQQS